jgi:phosphoglycerate dehydrogenase-like enzyme
MRLAVLDDYQNVALSLADWSVLQGEAEITVFNRYLGGLEEVAEALQGFQIIAAMRERTPFPRALFERLPELRLLVTTGARNASIDVAAARDHGVVVCGTSLKSRSTAELTWGLILAAARHIAFEDRMMRAGHWQTTVGFGLAGRTLGIMGLGHQGAIVAEIGRAFRMRLIAWSQNLTAARAAECGAELVDKDELMARSDVLTIHLKLGPRSSNLIGAADLARMKPTAWLVNTSRGPIVNQADLIAALQARTIAGAAMDVYDTEPLPADHPLRHLPNTVLSPHVGYVTEENYRGFYRETVEDIRAWLDGKPVRVITDE